MAGLRERNNKMKAELNVELLLEVADYIETNPEHYNQGTFGSQYQYDLNENDPVREAFQYRTPCCVGGIVVILRRYQPWTGTTEIPGKDVSSDIQQFARKELGLTYGQEAQLLRAAWPTRWLELAGLNHPHTDADTFLFTPRPKEAVAILRKLSEEGAVW